MSHPIIHIEISAADRQEAVKFYTEIFGWQTQDFPQMNYTTFSFGQEGMGGGFNPVQEGNPPGTVVPYIQTDDIDAVLAKVEAKGGKTLMPKMEIPGVGFIAQFSDPTGNRMALLTPAGNM